MSVDDLAKQLNVSNSTIKKYYLLIEERGYLFQRNKQGHVTFSQNDFSLFKAVLEIKSQPKTTLNSAIDQALRVINENNSIPSNSLTKIDDNIPNTKVINNISEKLNSLSLYVEQQEQTINRQNELIKEQGELLNELTRINKQNKFLLEQDNKNALLKDNLIESNEIKEILKRVESQLYEEKRKKWWKFW